MSARDDMQAGIDTMQRELDAEKLRCATDGTLDPNHEWTQQDKDNFAAFRERISRML